MMQSSQQTGRTEVVRRSGVPLGLKRGAIELTFLAILYIGYSASRLLASNDFAPARGRALDVLAFEKSWRIDAESWLNDKFVQYDWLGLFGSYWYATTHYIVTAAILVWIFRRSVSEYVTARRALVFATIIGLSFYLVMPTAPPRMISGMYVDILSLHSASGWWGADASAPKGLGGMTNELAAFPSLHAGWSLWVALALQLYATRYWVRVLGWLYALGTAIVIVGTGNHWVIDAVVGWVVILAGWTLAEAMGRIPLNRLWDRLWHRPEGDLPTLDERPERPEPEAPAIVD
jgi:hypothetical protein